MILHFLYLVMLNLAEYTYILQFLYRGQRLPRRETTNWNSSIEKCIHMYVHMYMYMLFL